MIRAIFLLAVACLASSCHKPRTFHSSAPPPRRALIDGSFLTSAGTWNHEDRGIHRDLTIVQTGNEVAWTDVYTPALTGTVQGSFRLASPADPWFFYVESPECIWIFDGLGDLQSETISGLSMESRKVISGGELDPAHGRVPPEVIMHLPAALQKLLPTGGNPPSI